MVSLNRGFGGGFKVTLGGKESKLALTIKSVRSYIRSVGARVS
jgi:hypothetical protein